MKHRLLILLLLILCTTQLLTAQHILTEAFVENVEQRVKAELNPSIAIGIIDSTGMYFYSFGTKTIGGDAVDEHTIYEIGSISKSFTATLLAEAVVEGKMKIDDPANKYLPKNAQLPSRNGVDITLGHLSDHTSSIPRMPANFDPADPSNPYADYTQELLYEEISSLELTRDIGSQFEYSNLAQGLLGTILANQAGMSYEELVVKTISTPLEMNETKVTLNKEMKNNLAIGHNNGAEVSNWSLNSLTGAGGIRSSTSDMLIYLGANMGLTTTDLKLAMELAHTPRHDKAGGEHVGLAWFIKQSDGGDIVWHNGATGGYSAFSGFNKEKMMGVVVLTNSTTNIDDLGIYLLDNTKQLQEVKAPATIVLRKAIDNDGIEAGIAQYSELKEQHLTEYDFNEADLNRLGYHYLGNNNIDAALAIFKLNITEYPESFNVYDSYGEALREDGQDSLSIVNYKKSVELNPGNTAGIQALKEMGVDAEVDALVVDETILESYVGSYELAPSFSIVVTRDGSQLFGQATGQAQFELFATSDTEFYLKIVPAKVVFAVADGEVKSLTLFQNGQEMLGKKTK